LLAAVPLENLAVIGGNVMPSTSLGTDTITNIIEYLILMVCVGFLKFLFDWHLEG
jgi:hypothetical protein